MKAKTKKVLKIRLWYFDKYDEEGNMNKADFDNEEEYNDFIKRAEGSIEIFDEKEIYVDANDLPWNSDFNR